jgi:antitoxin (DNA-binding transcriptional repressor) of toxin-antitoxin stability system
MTITEFKAKCISALKAVQADGECIVVTLRGRPLATVGPAPANKPQRRLWALDGQMRIIGEIVETDFAAEWEMAK